VEIRPTGGNPPDDINGKIDRGPHRHAETDGGTHDA
jgi:hypothetical protein